MKKGFTLIELLVVVLIIGILTAVALPKYEKAQRKALFTEVQMVSKTLMTAVEVHGMSNGYYQPYTVLSGENSPISLDVDIAWEKCEGERCYTDAGSWKIWAQLNKFHIDFWPNTSKFKHSYKHYSYRFSKSMEGDWTLTDSESNASKFSYNSTYQLFCDWWVDGGGATTAGFASKCK